MSNPCKKWHGPFDDLSADEMKDALDLLRKVNVMLSNTCAALRYMNKQLCQAVNISNDLLGDIRNFPTTFDSHCSFD